MGVHKGTEVGCRMARGLAGYRMEECAGTLGILEGGLDWMQNEKAVLEVPGQRRGRGKWVWQSHSQLETS